MRAYHITCNGCRVVVEVPTNATHASPEQPPELLGWSVVSVETMHPAAPPVSGGQDAIAHALRLMSKGMEKADEPEIAQAYKEAADAAKAEAQQAPAALPVSLRLEADLCPKCGPRYLGKLTSVLVSS